MKNFLKWCQRITLFLLERFPPHLFLTQSILGSLTLFYSYKLISQDHTPLLSAPLFFAIGSTFFQLLLMRVADEYKDREVDKILFPQRCLPSGKVSYKDISFLAIISLIVLILLYFFGHSSVYLFLSLMAFTFLFYKYFFFPQFISIHLLWALFTHCPITLILNSYLLTFFTPNGNLTPLPELLSIACGMWMSAIAWETARKIKLPCDETDYVTYSKILGTPKALFLPFTTLLLQTFFFGYPLGKTPLFLLLFLPLFLLFILLWTAPTQKRLSLLRPMTEAHITLGLVTIILLGVYYGP